MNYELVVNIVMNIIINASSCVQAMQIRVDLQARGASNIPQMRYLLCSMTNTPLAG
jgi:hypothetical protein